MNMKQLEYFIAAAELLSFTKAAEKCYISQTAMTQQIKSMENSIGVSLFIRDKHHVELTAAGKLYLNEARSILDKYHEAIKLTRLVSEGVHGEITIGFISGFGQSDFTDILKRYHFAFPNIKINLLRNNSIVLQEKLERHECDLIFSLTSLSSTSFQHKYIRSYPVMAVIYDGHPLSQKKHLSYRDLRNESFIMMQPPTRKESQMEESILIYERGGYLPNIVHVDNEQETILLMVSVGMGISLMPEYITKLYSDNPTLKFIPLLKDDNTSETLDMEVFWNKNNKNPAVESFLELC